MVLASQQNEEDGTEISHSPPLPTEHGLLLLVSLLEQYTCWQLMSLANTSPTKSIGPRDYFEAVNLGLGQVCGVIKHYSVM